MRGSDARTGDGSRPSIDSPLREREGGRWLYYGVQGGVG